ncbi:MAG: hypothetical protein AAF213_08435 [Pseudomonadota bacterium]
MFDRFTRLGALAGTVMILSLPMAALAQDSLLPRLFAEEAEEAAQTDVEPENVDEGPQIDLTAPGVANCPDAPSDAYIYIPEPIFEWAQLVCRTEGHFITSADGYDWRSMDGSAFEVTAKNNDDLVATVDQLPYYVEMGVQELDTGNALRAAELIDALVGQLSIDQRPIINKNDFNGYWRLYILTKGQVQIDLYFFLIDEIPRYFVFCEKRCSGGRRPELVRVIASSQIMQRQRVNQ